MTENMHAPQRIMRRQLWLVALAAVALAGCSSSAGSTNATSDKPAPSPMSAPTVTVTATPAQAPAPAPAPAPVTVTVAPAPAPTTVVQVATDGPASFRSPSGNINCTLSTPGGDIAARCEVVEHSWVAPPRSPDCHLDWGDRVYLTQGSAAGWGCYGQEFPAAEQTLGYGQSLSLGTITCNSEYAGMTCTDNSTGHYFRVSREGYELG